MYERSKRFAGAGLTHFAHLLTGTGRGECLRIMTWAEVQHAFHAQQQRRRPMFCTRAEYDALVAAIPVQWKQVVVATASAMLGGNLALRAAIAAQRPTAGDGVHKDPELTLCHSIDEDSEIDLKHKISDLPPSRDDDVNIVHLMDGYENEEG